MIDNNALYRPGLAAIAAVLALSSTPVMAQVTLPAEPSPVAAPVAPVAAPVAAVQSAPVQTVQSVPATPELPDIAVPETTRTAKSMEAPVRHAVARTAERAAPARITAAAPAPAAENAAPAAPVSSTPAAQPKVNHVTPIVATPPRDAQPAPSTSATSAQNRAEDNYAGWALLGGGLLLVAGGAAFAMTRRPKRRDEGNYVTADEDLTAISPAPVLPAEPIVVRSTPRQPSHDPVPGRIATPVSTMAGEPRMTQTIPADSSYADLELEDRRAVLEAMIAEEPSEANPFHSRRNRLRRADFLLRTGKAEPRQGEYTVTDERELETIGAKDRWSEMRMQGSQKARVSWRPARS